MSSDKLDQLKERYRYLTEWLERNKEAQRVLPYVHEQLELTEWEINALSNLPNEADEVPQFDFQSIFRKENDHLKAALPMMPKYDLSAVSSSSAYTLSGTTTVTAFITRIGEINTRGSQDFANKYMSDYREIQESQSRPTKVRKLIELLGDEKILNRYEVACEAYVGVKSDTVNRAGAASEMRNLLHGVKMGLFDHARKWPKENMNWSRMAHRLSKSDYEKDLLSEKEKIHFLLIDDLSHILKEQDKKLPINLDHKWSQVLDHIYSIISLTNISTTP
jgi:hypothetical protein